MNKKTGLYFGSFNPVHIGHLAIANYIACYSDLGEIWFIVSPQNPFKDKQSLLAERQRLYMVNLAIAGDTRFKACDIEFSLPRPSYTINTLAYLSEKHPDRQFLPIVGSDNMKSFHKWKNSQQILEQYGLLVYPRLNAETNAHSMLNATVVDAPHIEISSSFIRNAIAEAKDVRHFLHPDVWKYIEEMNFYR